MRLSKFEFSEDDARDRFLSNASRFLEPVSEKKEEYNQRRSIFDNKTQKESYVQFLEA
jgi:hypothetical protein